MKNQTVRQFAASLEVHPNTVYRWIDGGKLPCLKLGGLIRIRPSDVEIFFQRCEFDAANDDENISDLELLQTASSRDPFNKGVNA